MNRIETMTWSKLISSKRFGLEDYQDNKAHARSQFQRDYDRLIFSSPFRRLQNKTQVFPLPGSVFVHNRLTHSLEVSCVGRSLGNLVGKALAQKYSDSNIPFEHLDSIVSAACLAHDLGNPPFGHSGEKAISTFFKDNDHTRLRESIAKEGGRWTDLTNFEGNANSIRLLMHQFAGRREGGFVLTYTTLASIVKYPYSSEWTQQKNKFGFFQTEESYFQQIALDMGMIRHSESPLCYARHPLVYLVEAADDICYQIMDLEDAHKIHIFSTEEIIDILLNFFPDKRREGVKRNMLRIGDANEKISYLRSAVIGILIDQCVKTFLKNEDCILQGSYNGSLIQNLEEPFREAYKKCSELAVSRIYRSKEVLDVEIAGYHIITYLLQVFLDAVEHPKKTYSQILLPRIPQQYETTAATAYLRTMAILDFISGMTDVYALDLYRKIRGTNLPTL